MTDRYATYIKEHIRTMAGDREEDVEDNCDADEVYCGPSEEEAVAEAKSRLAEAGVEVTETRGGIGSITYLVASVVRYQVDDGGQVVDEDEDGDPIEDVEVFYETSMTDEADAAWEKAKKSYWKFLDYDAEGYTTVADSLGVSD